MSRTLTLVAAPEPEPRRGAARLDSDYVDEVLSAHSSVRAPQPYFTVPSTRRPSSRWRWLRRMRRQLRRTLAEEHGAVTAEYAIIIMAAVAFAGVLVAIMRSSEIRAMLVNLVENALGAAG